MNNKQSDTRYSMLIHENSQKNILHRNVMKLKIQVAISESIKPKHLTRIQNSENYTSQ